jgi:hypothetical protein
MSLTIEQKYLVVSIIILIISYSLLKFTKKNIHLITNIKDLENTQFNKTINLKTCKDSLEVDSNLFEMHMSRLKNNIIKISNNMTSMDCRNLKKYLQTSDINLKKTINEIKENDKDFCTDEFNRLIDVNILNYKKELESTFYMSNKNTSKSDKDNTEDLKDKIINVLLDMEVISFLIRNTSCKRNKVDISYIDNLLAQIYKSKCGSVENFISTLDDDKYFKDQTAINYGIDDILGDVDNSHQGRMIGKSNTKIPNRFTDLDQVISDTSYQNRSIPERYLPDTKPSSDCMSHYRAYGFTEPAPYRSSMNSDDYKKKINSRIKRNNVKNIHYGSKKTSDIDTKGRGNLFN